MFLRIIRQISIVILRCTEQRTLCTKDQGFCLIFSFSAPELLRRFPLSLQAYNTTVLQKERQGRHSIVGIATRYRLNGPVGTKFAVSPQRSLLCKEFRIFHRAKAAGTSCWQTTLFLRRGFEWIGTIPSPPLLACISMSWDSSSALLKNEPRSINFDVLSDRSFTKSPYHSISYKLNSQMSLVK